MNWLLSVASIAIVVVLLRDQIAAARDVRVLPPVGVMVAVAAIHVAGNGLLVIAWRDIVALAGPRLPFAVAARSWSVSQVARFTTPAAQVAARTALVRRHGVALSLGAASTLVEIVWTFAYDPLLALATIGAWTGDAPELRWLSVVSVLPLLFILATVLTPDRALDLTRSALRLPVVRRFGDRIADRTEGFTVPRGEAVRLFVVYGVNTGIRLAAFLLVVGGLTGGDGVGAAAVGAFALGRIVGRLAVFAPGGVGPREGVTLLVLTPVIGAAPALAAVVVTRVLEFIGEALALGVALAWHALASADTPRDASDQPDA